MTVTTPSEAKQSAGRRRLPLRFSLRLLLLAVTAFAIGFPVWYRWPYEEQDPTSGIARKRYFTWQRQWGGGRKKHGPARELVGDRLKFLATWRDDVKHGPSATFGDKGELLVSGSYVDGKPSGAWVTFDWQGREVVRSDYRGGRLWRLSSLGWQVEFADDLNPGKLKFNGREVEDRLARLAAEGRIDNPSVALQVGKPTNLEFIETRLTDGVDFLAAQHEIPIRLDPANVDVNQPITDTWKGIPLSTALTLVTVNRGLGCDYRYGCVWITSAEDAKDWRDPTGIADIVPPKDSQLAKSWNEPVAVSAIEQPLADVIGSLVGRLAIAVDISRISSAAGNTPAFPVTATFKGMKFQHVLGMLLYQTRCRCRLDGETLVILPPE